MEGRVLLKAMEEKESLGGRSTTELLTTWPGQEGKGKKLPQQEWEDRTEHATIVLCGPNLLNERRRRGAKIE